MSSIIWMHCKYLSIAMTCCFWCWKWNMCAEWANFLSPLLAAAAAATFPGDVPQPPAGGFDVDGDDFKDDLPLDGPGPVIPYAGYSTSWAALERLCHLMTHEPKQKTKDVESFPSVNNPSLLSSSHKLLIKETLNIWRRRARAHTLSQRSANSSSSLRSGGSVQSENEIEWKSAHRFIDRPILLSLLCTFDLNLAKHPSIFCSLFPSALLLLRNTILLHDPLERTINATQRTAYVTAAAESKSKHNCKIFFPRRLDRRLSWHKLLLEEREDSGFSKEKRIYR